MPNKRAPNLPSECWIPLHRILGYDLFNNKEDRDFTLDQIRFRLPTEVINNYVKNHVQKPLLKSLYEGFLY